MRPKISVIIPAYNVEKTIRKCIYSVLNQSIKKIEVIVINDNSSDNTLKILKKINNIIIINNDINIGPAASRNKGLDIAKGEYIGFVDADDFIDKTMYENMLKHMNSEVDLVCCSRVNLINNKKIKIINENSTDNPKEFSKTSNYCCDKLFKKDIIDKYKIKMPEKYKYAEDFYFLTIYKYYCNKMKILKQPYYYYFKDSENSITNSYNNLLDIINVLEEIIIFFQKESKFYEFENELLEMSIGFYIRRIREFKKFQNFKIKYNYVKMFLKYFKDHFSDYKKQINMYKSKTKFSYKTNIIMMIIYIYYTEIIGGKKNE